MHQYILAMVLGLFSQPSAPEAPAAGAMQAPTAALRLESTPLPAAETVRQARAAVKHEREGAPDGKVLHRFTFPDGTKVEFLDRARGGRDQARRERVVAHVGTERASTEPDATFDAAGKASGLSPAAIEALRFISRHEGGFDAINTWDRARFSWGFIQFAGGYGFPPALAWCKTKSREQFKKLFCDYGVDVQPNDKGEPQPVFVDPDGKVLRGDDAEQAYGDDPLTIALFIRAGRVPEMKQRQVEAAIRDYAAPALTATYEKVRLSDVLRSPQGLAMLIDRKVQEGNVMRLEWALEQAQIVNKTSNPADWPRLEAQVLDLAVQDADARANIAELAEEAAAGFERAAGAARGGQAQYVPDGPTLANAREALQRALSEVEYRMVVGYRRDALRAGFTEVLALTDPGQMSGAQAPGMGTELSAVAGKVRDLVSRFRFEYAIRNRLRNIRTSSLAGPRA